MAEYRPVTDSHRARYHAIMQQAFDPESGPELTYAEGDADEDPEDWPPDLSDPRGLFVKGTPDGADGTEIVSTCKLYTLDATVRGEWTEIGGLGGVATPPEHRRHGYSKETLRGSLEEYRDDGVDLVTLWPSTVRFYRGLGWGTVAWTTTVDVPPAQLSEIDTGDGVDGDVEDGDVGDGRFRQLDVEDWERLRDVEVARAERFGLSLRRSEDWWRKRTLAAWPGETAPYVHGYELEGDLQGYVLSRAREGEDGRRLEVQDLAGVDHATERILLDWLANFDSQVASVRLQGPLAADLLELVPDPGELEVERTVGSMIRLTDVERGLANLSWPSDASGRFALDVDDPLLERNDGTFVVDVEDGTAAVESVGVQPEADATVGVGTLSRLAVGSIGVERAERTGDLEIHDEPVRSTLEATFEPGPVCLREFF